ncbi:WYL domain-containing protein [Thiomicrorhabdus heinhorstiae]|uniref:WYL domain-containing protein n=1 Tax=Thiomicrorhabdus heinhorstiae TaxID=2748010 RepID=A0ABS0BUQ5_9GAMM|nr:WYL domain-containing protein [Thiomicrorhabdus heinhorstiae]MBF6057567.1 WYL domain-containing protein [Thiomicrorhabdus heinhorstiae]
MKKYVKYILLKSYWEYEVSRKDLTTLFGVNEKQASNYLAEVRKTYPDAIVYDASLKRYIPGVNIEKALPSKDFQEYLNVTENKGFETYNILPSKPVIPVLLYRLIYKAINNKFSISFKYHSLNSSSTKERKVYPHSLINSGYRWHIRGWEEESQKFKDYTLSRMELEGITLVEKKDDRSNIENDTAWNNEIGIFLIPNPSLSPEKRKIIALDFNMRDGILSVFCKEALMLYTLNSYLVTDFSEKPTTNQLLAIGNLSFISKFLPSNQSK